jgi:peptidoglycan-associated lipoprotein
MPIRRLFASLAAIALLGACAQNPPYADPPPGGYGAGSGTETIGSSVFGQGVSDTILFPVDAATLTPEAQATLTAQARWFNQNPGATAIVEGHADERGTREYNLGLGAKRASAVREFLVLNGVSDSRLTTVSYGKERPLAVCSDESCFARNRRAVTVTGAFGGAGL